MGPKQVNLPIAIPFWTARALITDMPPPKHLRKGPGRDHGGLPLVPPIPTVRCLRGRRSAAPGLGMATHPPDMAPLARLAVSSPMPTCRSAAAPLVLRQHVVVCVW